MGIMRRASVATPLSCATATARTWGFAAWVMTGEALPGWVGRLFLRLMGYERPLWPRSGGDSRATSSTPCASSLLLRVLQAGLGSAQVVERVRGVWLEAHGV